MGMVELLNKKYTGESLYDVERDVAEAIDEAYNPIITEIPMDEHHLSTGWFTVTITWEPDEAFDNG